MNNQNKYLNRDQHVVHKSIMLLKDKNYQSTQRHYPTLSLSNRSFYSALSYRFELSSYNDKNRNYSGITHGILFRYLKISIEFQNIVKFVW